MKRYCIILMIAVIPFVISSCLYSLEKEGITNNTIYKGRVIDEANKPISGVMVRITNGNLIHNSNSTNSNGIFEVSVDISKIDSKYYIQIGDESFNIKSSLKGFGHDIYDYGDIPFVDVKKPTVITLELTNLTLSSFTLKCEVKSQGAAKVTERGVCWSTKIPTIDDNKKQFGSGVGTYTCTISQNNFNFSTTTYYVRAYAENEFGVAYGEAIEINPSKYNEFINKNLPIVETVSLTDMTSNSFTIKCNVKSQGGSKVTERGVCWSTNIPTIDDNKQQFGSGEGIYECTISNVNFNFNTTTYYARAYAKNASGVAYGEPVEINSNRLAYFSLPSMEFGGYTYHIHPDLGGMQWEQGNAACENLVAYGYDDWFLPNKEEMLAIAENTHILNTNYYYWTSSSSYYANCFYYLSYYQSSWLISDDYGRRTNIRHIIPVRKDR